MTLRIAGLAGSLGNPSRTRALVALAAARAAARFGATATTYDLTDLQPSLGQATRQEDLAALPAAILETILSADALIVGSPVYKGSYTGLFKHLFDLIDLNALIDTPVLLAAEPGSGAEVCARFLHQANGTWFAPESVAALADAPLGFHGVLQCRECGLLHEPRQAVEHAQGEVFQVFGELARGHHPAQAPAAHGMGLGQAVERRGALGHARQARRADVLAFI